MAVRWSLLLLIAWVALGAVGHAEEKSAPAPAAQTSHRSETGYIESWPGELPLVLSAPHGGYSRPKELSNRSTGRLMRDAFTIELTMEITRALRRKLGKSPHVIVCHLARNKLDANREIKEAAQGNPTAEMAWHEYHEAIRVAERAVMASHRRGLYLDIHGHSHEKQRVEIGYLLGKDEIQWPAQRLNQPQVVARSSIRLLDASSDDDFTGLIRGPFSLGGLLEERGVPCVPSPAAKVEKDDLYFNGGYDTATHGSLDGEGLDAIQLEVPSSFRNEKVARERFARALADVLEPYFERHFKMNLRAR